MRREQNDSSKNNTQIGDGVTPFIYYLYIKAVTMLQEGVIGWIKNRSFGRCVNGISILV